MKRKCSNASEICGEVLWNNAWIVSNGETLYNEHFADKSILTVKNIMDESCRPLSWAEAKKKYNLNNSHVFNLFGLITSILRNWKNVLCTNPDRFTADIQNQINNVGPCIISKVAYQKLLKQLVKPPTVQKSLERMLGLEDVDWSRIYLLPQATTIESSLRSFQYKILNNTLYLNERLFKLNAVESPQCSLCKQFPESVLHLFCTCSVTRSLWVQFCLWASNANILLTSDLDPQYYILGMYREELQDQVIVNHLILLFKHYIFLKKGDITAPNLTCLKAYINCIEKLERNIASENKKMDYHYKKWDKLTPFL